MKKLVILGAGGFAREVALVLRTIGIDHDGYLSDDLKQHGQKFKYTDCIGSIDTLDVYDYRFIPGIGSPQLRRKLVERALAKQWCPEAAVSAHAHLASATRRRMMRTHGTVVCAGVSGTVNITIGNYVNVNLNCTLGHDCVIEDYVNLSPGVHISGNVHLEAGVDVGTGAVILPGVRVGAAATIGAGAVVNKDVPAGETWVGVPAKPLRKLPPDAL